MELLLVRHALPVRIEGADGVADPGLSPEGRCQAELLADYLDGERIDAVYASPLRRAHETVEPLAGARGLAVTVSPGVAEWDRESNEYVPVEELRSEDGARFHDVTQAAWQDDALMVPFRARVVAAVEEMIAAHPGQTVVVGCHAGVINLYLGEVLGLPPDRRGFFYPNYTSIHRVAANRSGTRTIITVNETAHLRRSGLPMGLFQKAVAAP